MRRARGPSRRRSPWALTPSRSWRWARRPRTPCASRGAHAYLSQHIGDLAPDARSFFDSPSRSSQLLRVAPRAVAHDLHPTMRRLGGRSARRRGARGGPASPRSRGVVHVEHGRIRARDGVASTAPVADQGDAWEARCCRRSERLRARRAPRADRARGRRPPSAAPAARAGGPRGGGVAPSLRRRFSSAAWRGADAPCGSDHPTRRGRTVVRRGGGSRRARTVTYEGQAAIEPRRSPPATAATRRRRTLRLRQGSGALVVELAACRPRCRAPTRGEAPRAKRSAAGSTPPRQRGRRGVSRAHDMGPAPRTVALTGGCFQNRLLTEWTAVTLERAGFEVLLHRRVPPNDGGLALGQAAVAAFRSLRRGEG